jgi:hypothetical protein
MIKEMVSEGQKVVTSAMEDDTEGLTSKGFGGEVGSSHRVVGTRTVRGDMSTTGMVRASRSILVGGLCWEKAPVDWPASITPTVAPNVAAAHREARRDSPELSSQSFVPRLNECLFVRARMGSFANADASEGICNSKGATAGTKGQNWVQDLSEMGSR